MTAEPSGRPPTMEPLEVLIGSWNVEAVFPVGGPTGVRGRTIFEWLLGGRFLLQRSVVDHPDAPDSTCIIGIDAATGVYVQHYFDGRGVSRLYAMTFEDGVWTLLRTRADFTPLEFAQRFTGRVSDDGDVIEGAWETSDDGGRWQHDFGLRYSRAR
jgi:hypothetical protein